MEKENMYIKEVSRLLGISENKIRFYEKKGLIKPERTESEYRVFSKEDIIRLQMIVIYRELGFSISDIENVIGNNIKKNLLDHFHKQWKIINSEIDRLRNMRREVESTLDTIYDSKGNEFSSIMIGKMDSFIKEKNIRNGWQDKWDFDKNASDYDKLVVDGEGELGIYRDYEKFLESIFTLSIENNNENKRFLEIGVGTGNLSKYYLNNKLDITGIDQSREMIKIAKKKFPQLKLRLGEFLKLPYDNNEFDIIVSSYAFHHLNEDEKLQSLIEMNRILKSDGKIIIGDLMFFDSDCKNNFYGGISEKGKEIIEDEYYTIVEDFKKKTSQLDLNINFYKFDEIKGVIVISNNY